MNKYLYIGVLLLLFACKRKTIETSESGFAIGDSVISALQLAKAQTGSVDNEITLNGTVSVNESNTAGVYSLVSGKITRVLVEQGDYVKKSQPLAYIESAETSETASLIAHKENQLDISRKNLALKKELFEQELATNQEVAEAEYEVKMAESELTHANRVAALKGGKNGIHTLRAPISGYVIQKNIHAGSELREDRDDALFTISNLASVWIIASVFEQDISSIEEGMPVRINTLTNTKEWNGKIDKIYKVLDEENRTMRVRINVPNAKNELMPGMFAKVQVKAAPYAPAIVIPSEAVFLSNSRHYVIVKEGNAALQPREIEIIRRVNGKSLVKNLQQGEEVVLTTPLLFYEELTQK